MLFSQLNELILESELNGAHMYLGCLKDRQLCDLTIILVHTVYKLNFLVVCMNSKAEQNTFSLLLLKPLSGLNLNKKNHCHHFTKCDYFVQNNLLRAILVS